MNTAIVRLGSIAVVAWTLLQGGKAHAIQWKANASGNFNTGSNWVGNVAPTSSDTATFGVGTAANYTVTLNGAAPGFPPVVHTVDRVVVDSNTVTLARNSLLGATSLAANKTTTTEAGRAIVVGSGGFDQATLNTSIPVTAAAATIADAAGSSGTWNVTASTVTLNSSPNSGTLIVGNSGVGSLNVSGGAAVEVPGGQQGIVVGNNGGSSGTITVSGDGSKLETGMDVVTIGNSGTGTLNITHGGVVRALLFFDIAFKASGEVLVSDPGSYLIADDLSVGAGTSGTLNVVNLGNVLCNQGSVNNGSTALVSGSDTAWSTGILDVGVKGAGTLNVEAGGAVFSADGTVGEVGGSTSSNGSVVLKGTGSTWILTGKLSIGGDAQMGAPAGTGMVDIPFGGFVEAAKDTTLYPGGSLSLKGGTFSTRAISFQGGQFLWTSGTLHVGIYNGDLSNPSFAILAPGADQSVAGSTTIVGNYTQQTGAKLQIEVGGESAGGTYDLVGVTGQAILGGQLELDMLNGFVPNASDTFTVLNAASGLFGVFSNVTTGQRLKTEDGLGSFIVNYGAGSAFNQNQIVLSTFLIQGDYNQNGIVDAADYTIWRDTLGQSGANLAADGDRNGTIDAADYDIWKMHFGYHAGSGASASTAVPEPTTLVLLLTGILTLCSYRRPKVS